LQLSRRLQLRTLGVGVYDAAVGGDPMAADTRPLLDYSSELSSELAKLAPDQVQARVLAPQGWLLARSGRLLNTPGPTVSRAGSPR
jgi:two-component system sensor histidine kinase ChvG